jgi:hypothetical protein
MSVTTGQKGEATTFNSAFLSKLLGGAILGVVNLLKPGIDPVYDLQQTILDQQALITQLQADLANASAGFELLSETIADGAQLTPPTKRAVMIKVVGDSAPVDFNILPFGDSGDFSATQIIRIYGTDNTNSVTLKHNDNDYGCILNGDCLLKKGNMIELFWDNTSLRFVEIVRN